MTSKIVTIERHILDQQKQYPKATGAFTNLLYDIALAAKMIARETTRAGLADILGRAGGKNVHDEEQQKLDVYAHETIVRLLDYTGRLSIMASEESAAPIPIPSEYPAGHYALLFDPLDGSSNIDYNVSVGTIFAIYRKISGSARGQIADLLQPGYRQVGAGYVVYGSSTMLVYTTGQGAHGFTLDPSMGEFLLSHPDIRIPAHDPASAGHNRPKSSPRESPGRGYYSVNAGYEKYWSEGVRRTVKWLTGQDQDEPSAGMPLRYIGSLVADFHRTLLAGGIFMYPADRKDPKRAFGKLRLLYECAPLAFIAEQAGGYASDGVHSILNLQPHDLHQRVPFFIGERRLVEKAEEFIGRYDGEWIAAYEAAMGIERQ